MTENLIWYLAGVASTLIAIVFKNYLQKLNERSQQVWQADFNKCHDLRQITGYLTEHLTGHNVKSRKETLDKELQKIDVFRGVFRHDPALTEAIRDFEHTAAWILDKNGRYDSLDERNKIVAELEERYSALLKETDRVIDRKRNKHVPQKRKKHT